MKWPASVVYKVVSAKMLGSWGHGCRSEIPPVKPSNIVCAIHAPAVASLHSLSPLTEAFPCLLSCSMQPLSCGRGGQRPDRYC